jgi:hypothetical protein
LWLARADGQEVQQILRPGAHHCLTRKVDGAHGVVRLSHQCLLHVKALLIPPHYLLTETQSNGSEIFLFIYLFENFISPIILALSLM